MEFTLPDLPFSKQALEPHMSAETLEYHHGKHHKAYVTKLNELVKGSQFENSSLEEIILSAEGSLFNNAAQHWNHTFFWNCLAPQAGGTPKGQLSDLINKKWGNFQKFQEEFTKLAVANFGSGWTWLVQNENNELSLLNTSNADNPLKHGMKALLTLDVWEHAYYIDYRNSRPDFLKNFWSLANWEFASANLTRDTFQFSGKTYHITGEQAGLH